MASPSPPLPNSYWVEPERLLDAGIACFIDLTEPGELASYEDLLPGLYTPNAVTYLRKPIHDHGLPEFTGQMEEILDELDSALVEGRRIYPHCRAGVGRTNLVAGCWLARDNEIQALADALFDASRHRG